MAIARIGLWPLLLGAVVGLSACVEGSQRAGGEDATVQSGEMRVTDRDLEAPQVFKVSEPGLWDGRPSLGGVWVAHPDVGTPERVLIRNAANGKTVIGALFRRERANPGPRLQISSDAAGRLGILAGQPTELSVVALRRETEEAPAEAAPAVAGAAAATEEAASGEATDAAAAAGAAAADPAAAAAATDAAPQPVPEDAPPTSLGRRARPAAAAGVAAGAAAADAAADTAADSAAGTTAATPAVSAAEPASGAAPAAAAAAGAAAAVATEPQPEAEDASPSSFGRRRPKNAEPAPTEAADGAISVAPLDGSATAEPAAAAPAASPLRLPYLQAATLSSEASANTAVAALRAAGLTAVARETTSGTAKVWRVIVGPAASAQEREATFEKLKGLGYSDAYPVRG